MGLNAAENDAFSYKINIAEVNQRRCLEETGQWLENGDRTNLFLANGKLVLHLLALSVFNRSDMKAWFF